MQYNKYALVFGLLATYVLAAENADDFSPTVTHEEEGVVHMATGGNAALDGNATTNGQNTAIDDLVPKEHKAVAALAAQEQEEAKRQAEALAAKKPAAGNEALEDKTAQKVNLAAAKLPFYKETWFIVVSGVIVAGAIGGGVYMFTQRESGESTDL